MYFKYPSVLSQICLQLRCIISVMPVADLQYSWDRIPRAGRESWCCISPSVRIWRWAWRPSRRGRPGKAPRWARRGRILSTWRSGRGTRPSCQGRGQTTLPAGNWCPYVSPAYRQCHLPNIIYYYTWLNNSLSGELVPYVSPAYRQCHLSNIINKTLQMKLAVILVQIVKPVNNRHQRDSKKVSIIYRSLFVHNIYP